MKHQIFNSQGNYTYNARTYESGTNYHSHFHKSFELLYSLKGRHSVCVDGTVFELGEGELVLIPPAIGHSFTVEDGKLWIGVFSSDFVAHFAKNNGDKIYSKFTCREAVNEYLQKVLLREAPHGIPSQKYLIKSALYAVCNECTENAAILKEKHDIHITNAILDYISKNFERPLTMETVADELGYEYHYFSHVFHDCFSMNFKSLLNLYRFEKACDMIEKTDMSLTDIALESGFQSVRNFNSIFKAHSGMTPSEYRKLF